MDLNFGLTSIRTLFVQFVVTSFCFSVVTLFAGWQKGIQTLTHLFHHKSWMFACGKCGLSWF